MRIIDLTGLIEEGMWSYGPPLPKVRIKKIKGERGETDYSITLGSISGTYLETSAHRFPNQPSLDEIPLKRLITEAVVIKLKRKKEREHNTRKELFESKIRIKKGDALLISTGWEKNWNKKNFVSGSPHFSKEAMEWILEKEISILGADIPCYDDPNPSQSEGLVNKLFKKKVLILAPLVNLRKIKKERMKLIVLPPRIKDTCAFPCRAIAIEE